MDSRLVTDAKLTKNSNSPRYFEDESIGSVKGAGVAVC